MKSLKEFLKHCLLEMRVHLDTSIMALTRSRAFNIIIAGAEGAKERGNIKANKVAGLSRHCNSDTALY